MVTKAQKQIIASYVNAGEELAEQHVAYIDQFVARANDELYTILGNIMALCIDIRDNAESDKIVDALRKKLRADYSIRTQKNSTPVSIIVRYVIRSCRKTSHVYSRVITKAMEAGVEAAQLPDFIREHNGIDAIRKKGANALSASKVMESWFDAIEKLGNAIHESVKPKLGTVSLSNGKKRISLLHDPSRFQFLICDGLDVVGVVYPNSDVENMILRDYLKLMSVAAKRDLPSFWKECKDMNVDIDTLNSWREANGFAVPSDVVKYLSSVGLNMKTEVIEAIYKVEAARKMNDEKHKQQMEERTQAMEELQRCRSEAANQSQEKAAKPKLKLAA